LWCLLYYTPFYFEGIKGQSAILAGVSLFPQTFTVAPASVVTGVVAAMTGQYRWATWAGWFLTTLGMGLFLILDLDTPTAGWAVIGVVGGVGFGFLFASMALAIQASSSNKHMAHAVILFAFFRAFGQTVGVAVGGVVFQNVMLRKLLTFPLLAPRAHEYAVDSSGLVEIIKAMPQGTERTQLLTSYMAGLRAIYALCLALAAVSFIVSLWTEALPLDREHETEQGFQHRRAGSDEESRDGHAAEKDEAAA
jgi:hypothetical protein